MRSSRLCAGHLTISCLLAALYLGPSPAAAQTCDAEPPPAPSLADTLEELKMRVEQLELELQQRRDTTPPDARDRVDLSPNELPSPVLPLDTPRPVETAAVSDDSRSAPADTTISQSPERAVLARPWFGNFNLSGFAALEYLDSGKSGTRPFGGFLIRESSVFLEAAAWQDLSVYVEIQVNRLGKDSALFVRTGEVHAHWRNLFKRWGDGLLNVKVGRVDIPFGEDYLSQDAIDNPLLSFTAAYPYGFDEGVVAYGTVLNLRWIASVTDGTDERSVEDNGDKAVTLKLSTRPHRTLYVSGSYMRTGRTAESALEFGGSHIEPVGQSVASTLGRSPSGDVAGTLAQADMTQRLGPWEVAATIGRGHIDDRRDAFDRDLAWLTVAPRYWFRPNLYAIARYSEIGTYDATRGYHFDGKISAGGNAAYGDDVRRFQRLSLGAGLRPNPRALLKAEVGWDRFSVIDASPYQPRDDDRMLIGVTLVVAF